MGVFNLTFKFVRKLRSFHRICFKTVEKAMQRLETRKILEDDGYLFFKRIINVGHSLSHVLLFLRKKSPIYYVHNKYDSIFRKYKKEGSESVLSDFSY